MHSGLSPSHRAVLSIANIQLAGVLPKNFHTVFKDVIPEEFVRIAQSNHIHPLVGRVLLYHPDLQDVLPRDLSLYFVAMYRANQERLEQSRVQLTEIGQAFAGGGISGIVMKGGGDVLNPLHDDPAIRFSSDLDILVGQEHAARAEEILLGLGAQSLRQEASGTDDEVNWRGVKYAEHHLPKIIHPNWLLPVELHILAGRGVTDQLLPVSELLVRKVADRNEVLSVMSPEDRACHLIAHADHHEGEVDLRAWVDWSALRKRCDRGMVREQLAREGLENAFATFEAMADHLEATVSDPSDSVWHDPAVRSSLRNFGDTTSRRRSYLFSLVKNKLGALARSPEYRAYMLKNMMSTGWWKQVWITHKTNRRNQR